MSDKLSQNLVFTLPDAWRDEDPRSPLSIATAFAAEDLRDSPSDASLGDRQAAAVAAEDEDKDAITFEGDVYG